MAKASDNEFPSVLFDEQASDVATPGSGLWRAYFKATGLHIIDDTGTVLGPLGSSAIRVEDEGSSTVAAATALNFAGAGVTVTDAGSGEATVTIPGASTPGAWTAYTPTVAGGTLGNGTAYGRHLTLVKLMYLRAGIVSGSTTSLGSSEFSFSLPSGTSVNADPNCVGSLIANGGGASTHVQGSCRVVKNTSVLSCRSSTPLTTGTPHSFSGAGWTIDAQIVIELA